MDLDFNSFMELITGKSSQKSTGYPECEACTGFAILHTLDCPKVRSCKECQKNEENGVVNHTSECSIQDEGCKECKSNMYKGVLVHTYNCPKSQKCSGCGKQERAGQIVHFKDCEERDHCMGCGKLFIGGKTHHYPECEFLKKKYVSAPYITYGRLNGNAPTSKTTCLDCKAKGEDGIVHHKEGCTLAQRCRICETVEKNGVLEHTGKCGKWAPTLCECGCPKVRSNKQLHTMSCKFAPQCYDCEKRSCSIHPWKIGIAHDFFCKNRDGCRMCGRLVTIDGRRQHYGKCCNNKKKCKGCEEGTIFPKYNPHDYFCDHCGHCDICFAADYFRDGKACHEYGCPRAEKCVECGVAKIGGVFRHKSDCLSLARDLSPMDEEPEKLDKGKEEEEEKKCHECGEETYKGRFIHHEECTFYECYHCQVCINVRGNRHLDYCKLATCPECDGMLNEMMVPAHKPSCSLKDLEYCMLCKMHKRGEFIEHSQYCRSGETCRCCGVLIYDKDGHKNKHIGNCYTDWGCNECRIIKSQGGTRHKYSCSKTRKCACCKTNMDVCNPTHSSDCDFLK